MKAEIARNTSFVLQMTILKVKSQLNFIITSNTNHKLKFQM